MKNSHPKGVNSTLYYMSYKKKNVNLTKYINVLTTKCNFKQLKFLLKNSILYYRFLFTLPCCCQLQRTNILKRYLNCTFSASSRLYMTNIFLQQGDTFNIIFSPSKNNIFFLNKYWSDPLPSSVYHQTYQNPFYFFRSKSSSYFLKISQLLYSFLLQLKINIFFLFFFKIQKLLKTHLFWFLSILFWPRWTKQTDTKKNRDG